jgi:bifunctional non-homologous end joining protein LigD
MAGRHCSATIVRRQKRSSRNSRRAAWLESGYALSMPRRGKPLPIGTTRDANLAPRPTTLAPPPDPVPLAQPALVERPPVGTRWAHEIKWDGWRVQAHLAAGLATLYTQWGKDCTRRFPSIAAAMENLPAKRAVLDGEAVAIDSAGRSNFHAVSSVGAKMVYKAFDILMLDGEDLRPLPWSKRKRRLEELLKLARGETLSYVEAVEGDGAKVYAEACKLGLEGIVSKRVDSPYRGGRSDHWLKCRCHVVDTVTVIGLNGRRRIEALHVARAEKGELSYAGRVEHGLTDGDVDQLEPLLRPRMISYSPLMKKGKGMPVIPGVLVDISHRGVTAGGVMRHPRFVRLRDDLNETAKAPSRRAAGRPNSRGAGSPPTRARSRKSAPKPDPSRTSCR